MERKWPYICLLKMFNLHFICIQINICQSSLEQQPTGYESLVILTGAESFAIKIVDWDDFHQNINIQRLCIVRDPVFVTLNQIYPRRQKPH